MRTSVRARRDASGFSLIELMVAIIIAAIIFAAMVPLFISAAQAAERNKMRVIALQVAQDRIEKIRQLQLDFGKLRDAAADDAAYPNQNFPTTFGSSTWADGMFGSTWPDINTPDSRITPNKFRITYALTQVPPAQMVITVTVNWDPPPKSSLRGVVVTTYVSQQFPGPQITAFNVTPVNAKGDVNLSPATLTATIMPGADVTNTDYVSFSVLSSTGTPVPKENFVPADPVVGGKVTNNGTYGHGLGGVYICTWNASASLNGTYIFLAQATAKITAAPGNSYEFHTNLTLNAAPAKVTGLTATPGNQSVTLTWNASTASDFDHYEVWRGTTAGGESLAIDNLTANGITDTGLTNGTKYYYFVYAVDKDHNESPKSDEKSATPALQADTTPPSAPGGFTAVREMVGTEWSDQAELTWTAASDAESGILCYYIYRDGGATPFGYVPGATLSYSDIIGYTVAHSYYVVACNGFLPPAVNSAVGLLSAPTATLTVATATPPTYSLTVTSNKTSPAASVNVVQTDALPLPVDWGTKTVTSISNGVWSNPKLPYGWYKITAIWNGQPPVSQAIWLNGAKTVPFSF